MEDLDCASIMITKQEEINNLIKIYLMNSLSVQVSLTSNGGLLKAKVKLMLDNQEVDFDEDSIEIPNL